MNTDTYDLYCDNNGNTLRLPPALPSDGYGEDLLDRQRQWLRRQASGPRLQLGWMAEGRRGLSPDFFVSEMRFHWVYNLENVSTTNLETMWRAVCVTFNSLLEAKQGDAWPVLSPPTGSGKSQSSCLYSALLALYTDDGVLFTTRLIDQCEIVVADINAMAEFHFKRYSKVLEWKGPVAITAHSKQGSAKPDPMQIDKSPVLVVTHAHMVNAYKEALAEGVDGKFNVMTQWTEIDEDGTLRKGKARIRITDETPAGLIEHFRVDKAVFESLTGFFETQILQPEHLEQYEAFKCVRNAWMRFEAAKNENKDPAKVFTLSDFLPKTDVPKQWKLTALFELLRETSTRSAAFKTNTMADIKAGRLEGLYAVQHILNNWSVYMKNGGQYGSLVTSAHFVMPADDVPMAILDATSAVTPLWKVLGTKVRRVDTPTDIRNYKNVTAHLCHTAGGMGTDVTNGKLGKARLDAILKFFEQAHKKTGRKLRVLLCLPKALKETCIETLKDGITAKVIPPYMEDFKVGSWGALDGRNDFQDCNAVVIMSWFYPPRSFGIDLLFSTASETQRTDDYLKDTRELQKEVEFGSVMTSTIQAINRVQCRKVVDKDGGCEETQIFMLMADETGREAQDMREALEREMPGMVFKDWEVLPKPKGGRVSHAQRLIEFLKVLPAGEYRFGELMDKLAVSASGRKDIQKALNNKTSSLSRSLAVMQCVYLAGKHVKAPSLIVKSV